MPGEDPFKVEGVVVQALPNQTFQVQLSNGHRLLAYRVGKARTSLAHLSVGQVVKLHLSPYDLSEGRIVVDE
jgi:translation initiation factor IF-1